MSNSLQPKTSRKAKGIIVLSSVVAALGLFVAIPLIQAISTGLKSPTKLSEVSFSIPPPKVLETEILPPPQKVEKEEDIELDRDPPKLNLEQLEMALTPGTGDIVGSVSLDLSVDSNSLGTDDMIFEIGDVQEKPRAVRQVAPVYPSILKRKRVEGMATLVFVIDQNGTVVAPRIESSTRVEFEQPALEAIRRWKFVPGKLDGEAVKVRVRLPLQFVP